MTEELENDKRFFVVGIVFELSLVPIALCLGWLFGVSPLEQLPPAKKWLQSILLGTLLTLPIFLVAARIVSRPPAVLKSFVEWVVDMIGPLIAKLGFWKIVVLATTAGIGEELLFRGFLHEFLVRTIPGQSVWLAAIVGNMVFGLLHFLTIEYAVLAFMAGCYLTGIYLWFEDLCVAISVHAIYDICALYLLKAQYLRKSQK